MHHRAGVAVLVAVALALTACSGDEGDDAATVDTTAAAPADEGAASEDESAGEVTTQPPADEGGFSETETEAGADELPGFMSDFDRVCTTQVGFAGASAYEPTPGTHPIVLLEEIDEIFIESAVALPEGWTVVQDADFEDNSELTDIELVGCAAQVEATPNGTMCELDDDGETITLELTDTTYELTVYEATTGEVVGEPITLTATGTDCPFLAVYEPGDTTYDNTPTDEDYINALRPHVAPG